MNPSVIETFALPDAGVVSDPAPVARGTGVPVRALVRNTGPVLVFLSYATQNLGGGDPSSGTFELPPGATDVLVLSPGQVVYASGAGPGGRLSVSVSEALPLV